MFDFKTQLTTLSWSSVYNSNGPNEKYNSFFEIINKLHNSCFPLEKIRINTRHQNKPWITTAVLKSIKKKNSLYKRYMRTRTSEMLSKYKIYKNKLTTILRLAEKQYYANKLLEMKSNISGTWKLLNKMTCRGAAKKQRIEEIESNGCKISSSQIIAEKFNHFFSNIGPELAKKIPPSSKKPEQFLKGSYPHSMFFSPILENEIFDIISNLKNTTSRGYDNLPMSILKSCNLELCPILTYLTNESLTGGVFPDALKIAKVVPIFKAGDIKNIANYRPISVLSNISKIYEKLVCARLNKYLVDSSILHDNQFGFRPKLSTCLALLQLVDELTRSIDEGKITVGVFVDLAKAFDTVDHKILLNKLQYYGLRGIPHQWFTSYLSNRKQYVTVNNIDSGFSDVLCGVPQGSILGPILFIIYVNDLNGVSNKLRNIMFADDTNLFMTGKNISEIELQINIELNLLVEWFQANLLSLNISKTNYIIFCKKRKINTNIFIGRTPLERLQNTKFLGVVLSHDLSWNKHIDVVLNKISKNIGIIAKVRHLLPLSHTCILYRTLVEPYLNYCNLVWASQHKRGNLEKILKVQKKYCRIITFSEFQAHSGPLFKQLAFLTVYSIFRFQLAIFMYKCTHNLLPHNESYSFVTGNTLHSHATRHCTDLVTAYCRTTCRWTTVQIQGPKLWNSLPDYVKNVPSVNQFRSRVRKYVFSTM